MRRKLLAILSAVAVLALTVSPAFAQGIRLTQVRFSLGSLVADGNVKLIHTHLENARVKLHAMGQAEVACTDGHTTVPVDHLVMVEASGKVFISAHSFNRNGAAPFHVQTGRPKVVGHNPCAYGWRAKIGFVFWEHAMLTAEGLQSGLTDQNHYACETTRECVTCKEVREHHPHHQP